MFEWPWENFWKDLKDLLLWVPRRIWELLLEALAWLVNAIPVPSWFSSPGSLFAQLPEGMAWGFWLFNLSLGLTIIVSAYVLRFVIRRLPIVG